jgi:hypothetical protein
MAPLIQSVDTETPCVESSIPTQPIKVPLISSAARKPSISFKPNVLVKLTIHIDEYSDEEIAASWYCQEELKMIKSERTTTLLLMANDGTMMANSERLCSRGLECFTSEGRAIKNQHKEEARIAVFDEQDYQFENDIFDPEVIADAYSEQTRKSQVTATVVGVFDQEAVRQQSLSSLPIKISMKVGRSRSSSIGGLASKEPLQFLSRAA